jgi:hypothetical protein
MGLCPKCIKPPPRKDFNEERLRSVRVLKCPGNLFRDTFPLVQFRDGLKMGIWPLGMVVRDCDGDIVAVCGVGKCYKHPAATLPRQWLREL